MAPPFHRWGPCITSKITLLQQFSDVSHWLQSVGRVAQSSGSRFLRSSIFPGADSRHGAQESDVWPLMPWTGPVAMPQHSEKKNIWTLSSLALHNIATWRWMEMDENGWRWHCDAFRIRIHVFFGSHYKVLWPSPAVLHSLEPCPKDKD